MQIKINISAIITPTTTQQQPPRSKERAHFAASESIAPVGAASVS
jgi:hypothetical protein